jgi:hypothetical protein
MSMAVTGSVDTSQFNSVLNELKRNVGGDNHTWLTNAGKFLMKPLDIRTPTLEKSTKSIRKMKRRAFDADTESGADFWLNRMIFILSFKDRAKAGWWPAWSKLGAQGKPRITNAQIRSKAGDEGSLVDASRQSKDPYIRIINNAPHIESLDESKSIVQSAMDFQKGVMEKQLQKVYQRRLSRHN